MKTGNHLIDGDTGNSPASPYYTGKVIKEADPTTCLMCGSEEAMIHTIKFKDLSKDLRQTYFAGTKELVVCEECFTELKKGEK